MKTILVPTDFSPAANNAAHYAMKLARQLKVNVKLCNAVLVPAEFAMAAQIAWPMDEYDELKKNADHELGKLAHKLAHQDSAIADPSAFNPGVSFESQPGGVADVVSAMVPQHDVPFVVMGMSGAGALNRLMLGSNTRRLIDYADFPLLLIPPDYSFHPITKIAFATDLSEADINIIHALACIAKPFNAQLLLIHITEKFSKDDDGTAVKNFLSEISGKINYDKIYYRHVKSLDIENGLEWVLEHSKIDMLAMRHDHKSFLQHLFKGSHTQKVSKHTNLPLMVFAGCDKAKLFSVI